MDGKLKGFKSNCGHTQMGDLAIHRGRRMTESETRMAVNYGIEQRCAIGVMRVILIPMRGTQCIVDKLNEK